MFFYNNVHTMSFLLMTLVMLTPYPFKAVDTVAAVVTPAIGGEADGDEKQQ